MGNKITKKEKLDEIDLILNEAYKITNIELSTNEVTNLKLRIRDAEKYFHSKFEMFYNFNNSIFRERVNNFYENFNSKIESFSKNKIYNRNFNVLIDFEDESLAIMHGIKLDFESLFVILFEKLEISIIFFLDMTKVDNHYISEFFSQMTESADLFNYNRRFDCLYFLLPNADYFIKNNFSILYMSNRLPKDSNIFHNDEPYFRENEYIESVFKFKEKLINYRYPKCEAHEFAENLIDKIMPSYVRIYTSLNFSTGIENFILENEDQLKLFECIADVSKVNFIEISLEEWIDPAILKLFLKKIINYVDKSRIEVNLLSLKIVLLNKNLTTYEGNLHKKNKLKIMLNFLKNILYDLNVYNQIHLKRKLCIELFEIWKENKESGTITKSPEKYIKRDRADSFNKSKESSSSALKTSEKSIRKGSGDSIKKIKDYILHYEKLILNWFIPNKKLSEIKIILIRIVRIQRYKVLNNKKIINNIVHFTGSCYKSSYKYKIKKISKFEKDEILK
jgi:hypothetical protein